MRKLKGFLSALCVIALLLSGEALAEETLQSGDYEYRILEDGTAEITKYNGKDRDVVIPSQLDGTIVTRIGAFSFLFRIDLTSVTLPDSLTSIGEYAFMFCQDMTQVIIPAGVTNIGDQAFASCRRLESVAFSKELISIGNGAFSQCGLTSLSLPEGLKSIGDLAFESCMELTSVMLPKSVSDIGANPFAYCVNLIDINVAFGHEYLAMIDEVLFSKPDKRLVCYPCALTQAEYMVPDGVRIIGDSAFYLARNLKSVTISETVNEISSDAFHGCGIKEVIIPDSVTCFGNGAFRSCADMEHVTLPQNLENIEESKKK